MTEAQGLRQLPLRLPQEDYEALKNLSFFSGESMNSIVVRVLHSFLESEGRATHLDAIVQRGRDEYRLVLDKLADL